jgi:hypothetical protein
MVGQPPVPDEISRQSPMPLIRTKSTRVGSPDTSWFLSFTNLSTRHAEGPENSMVAQLKLLCLLNLSVSYFEVTTVDCFSLFTDNLGILGCFSHVT